MPRKSQSTEEFKKKLINKFPDIEQSYKLDFIYESYRKKIEIICLIHNTSVLILPGNLMKGHHCYLCGLLKMSKSKLNNKDIFLNKLKDRFPDWFIKYDFSSFEYKGAHKPVKIICPIHGEFLTRPNLLLSGYDCAKCNISFSNYIKEDWIRRAKDRIGTLYIIKCYNENEIFYKVGITFENIKQRFKRHGRMPYEYEIIFELNSYYLNYIWDSEKYLIKENKSQHYKPIISFGGHSLECFLSFNKDLIESLLLEKWSNKEFSIKINKLI